MQQQQQQQQINSTIGQQSSLQLQIQQTTAQLHHLGNNIIVVRGSRNENGEIVIQNKQDILSFLNEHHQQQQLQQQQQQQQQNEKATVATLTQLPSTTTVARKSLITNNNSIVVNTTTVATNTVPSSTLTTTIPKESNTILLQTPINASQLETVLFQSGQLKKSNSTVSASTERPFLLKNASRSLSTDSNRLGTITSATSGDDKGPFVLQTLKRLEKSQSILVIRNSSALGSNSVANASTTVTSSSSPLAVSSSPSTIIPYKQQQQQQSQNQKSSQSPASFNIKGNTVTLTRNKKAQKPNNNNTIITTTKLGNILNAATGQRFPTANKTVQAAAAATTTTTYLRLTNANNSNNNNNNNKNGNNNKNHNSSRINLNGCNVETKTSSTALSAKNPSSTSAHLTLADVQLKHDRTSPSSSSTAHSVISGSMKSQGSDGDPIKLPDNLESLPRADSFPSQRHRWNTNEEIAAILISFDKHNEWQSKEVRTRPKSGSLLLYSRKKVRYRRDGYCWKKRKDGKTTREDHMKLKVQGTECIYGCYVHSAILPTFHRRCYWLLQNPDIVLVHYLNVPYPDDNKMAVIAPSISLWGDKKEWTKEELVSQLKPMLSTVTSDDESDSGNDIEISTAETVETIVCQLMEKQRLSRQAALVKQLDCGCGDATCADGKTCTHPVIRRPSLIKSNTEKRLISINSAETYNNSSSTPNIVVGPKLYSKWTEKRGIRDSAANLDASSGSSLNMSTYQHNVGHHAQTHQLAQEAAIKFQIIPSHNEPQHHQVAQHYRHHFNANNNANNQQQLMPSRTNLIMQQQQQQHHQQQHLPNQSNFNYVQNNSTNNSSSNGQRYTVNDKVQQAQQQQHQQQQHTTASSSTSDDLINTQNHSMTTNTTINSNANNKINHNTNINNHNPNVTTAAMPASIHNLQQQQQQHDINVINNNATTYQNYNQQQLNTSNKNNNNNSAHNQPQQQQQHDYYKLQQDKQQERQQQQPFTAIEPMCMSPEHQTSNSSPQTHRQPQSQHHLISSSSSSSSASSSNSATDNTTETFSPPLSSLTPTTQAIMNINQKSIYTNTTNAEMTNNKITEKDANNGDSSNEMSSKSNDSSGIDNVNNKKNNSNNQLEEYTTSINKNKHNISSNGCGTLDSSNCKSSSVQELHQKIINNIKTNKVNSTSFDNSKSEQRQQQTEQSTSDLHSSLGFFNETLDLSHDDIQRTLIANMPNEGSLLTSLDFINTPSAATEIESTNNGNISSARHSDVDQISGGNEADDEDTDDVFANLDAFDMLVEFPELDLDDKQALSNTALEQAAMLANNNNGNGGVDICTSSSNLTQLPLEYGDDVKAAAVDLNCDKKFLKICDFSPEWSYPEGGVKVLVAGPWSLDNNYTVLFDTQPVPTTLVQEGVLRCYCPAHEVGYATLQVSSDGLIVSNSVMFEYKVSSCHEAPFDANTNDCLYKFSLYNRMSTIEETMQRKSDQVSASQQFFSLRANLEDKLVSYCHQLTKMAWQTNLSSHTTIWHIGYKGMTLLHLAAALGYNKLVCALLTWRSENPHIVLETEIDAFSQDAYGYTPLTWSCSRGHLETSIILYKWNQNALKIKNHAQQTPLDVAYVKGHKTIVAEIYRLEHERQRKQSRGSFSNLSINLGKYSLNNDESDDNPAFAIYDANDTQRSHDGVFLRPVPVASNQQSPPNSSRFSKRSSIDSGINIDIKPKPGKSFKDLIRLHSFDVHDNFSNTVESTFDVMSQPNITNPLLSPLRKMDFALCEVSTGDESPLPDQKNNDDDTSTIDNDDCCNDVTITNTKAIDGVVGDSDAKVLTLAEHIIAAMPERIKNEADEMMVLGSPMTEPLNSDSSGLNDSFMDPLLDSLPNTHFDNDFSFDYNDHNYRYHEVSTPCSSLSPASSGPLQSPASYSILGHDPSSVSSPSPPPSTKQLTEFLHASSSSQYPFEADFSKLTLTDTEQRELYEAAKCIQKAYRSYKGRQKLEEQNKERTAAIVIQNYYRRYKQYAYYRQMTNAALVIQHGYRSYCRNKRFKKSQSSTNDPSGDDALLANSSQDSTHSQCLSSFFDGFNNNKTNQQLNPGMAETTSPQASATPKETSPSGPLKRTYSQSTQNQAARKIQQFMRQSRINIWDGNMTILTTERTSRKREAGAPTQGGIPSKLAVSRTTGSCVSQRK